jgi:glycosyltransferase involved in cell wall biosynthesis
MFRSRNGIDLARFDVERCVDGSCPEKIGPRDPHKAIYSSSPDRGLAVLLDLWPRIREQVPDATLDVYYGFQNIEKALALTKDLNLAYVAARMKQQLAELPGVTDHGRVDQQTLARAMMGAGVLAYCTPWLETSCISAMESQAAGMRIVTTGLAALSETVGERGTLIDGPWLDEKYQDAFVTAVVDAMLVKDDSDRRRSMAYARANFGWDGVAEEWVELFGRLLSAEADDGELPPYVPDPEWAAQVAKSEATKRSVEPRIGMEASL